MEILVPLGVIMALYGVVYAVLENDCRRLLAYHIISQVGYMVAGVGLGTQMAINGACAHAFAHILYKGLLFMGCGAVLHMTGESKFTELGGLWKKMPWTFVFTLIGGLSISAFPLFSGFVSKSMIVAAGFEEHKLWVGFLLMLASAGTFLHTGLKVPYFIWFGKNNCKQETWDRAAEPPWNMNAAMAITSVLCIFIGCYTPYLYQMLPFTRWSIIPTPPTTSPRRCRSCCSRRWASSCSSRSSCRSRPSASTLDWFYRMGGRAFLWLAQQAGPVRRHRASASSTALAGLAPADADRARGRACSTTTSSTAWWTAWPPASAAWAAGCAWPSAASAGEPGARLRRGRCPDPGLPLLF